MFGSLFEDDDNANVSVKGMTSYSNKKHQNFKSASYYRSKPEHGIIGLYNQGATCYLNSLIQCLYMTPQFQRGIFSLTADELGIDFNEEKKNNAADVLSNAEVAKTEKSDEKNEENKSSSSANNSNSTTIQEKKEWELDEQGEMIVENLMAMGFERAHLEFALKTLHPSKDSERILDWCLNNPYDPAAIEASKKSTSSSSTSNSNSHSNPKTTEFVEEEESSVIVSLFDDVLGSNSSKSNSKGPSISMEVALPNSNNKETEKEKPKKKKRKMLIEMQRLFGWLKLTSQCAVSTDGLTRSFGWQGNQTMDQHDVHELNRILFDALERSLVGTSQQKLINDLYKGELLNTVVCTQCKKRYERKEAFQDVSVVVKGFNSMENSLASMVSFESLSGQNQYSCENCGKKVDAWRGTTFEQLPSVLIFALGRFEYDWKTEKRKKITSAFTFPLVLDMKPYTTSVSIKSIPEPQIQTQTTQSTQQQPSLSSSSEIIGAANEISLWNSNSLIEEKKTPQVPSNTPTTPSLNDSQILNDIQSDYDKIHSLVSSLETRLSSLESKQGENQSAKSTTTTTTTTTNQNKQEETKENGVSSTTNNGKQEKTKNNEKSKSNGKQQQQKSQKDEKQKEKEEEEEEVTALAQNKIDLESNELYELFGVVIHKGGAYGGHYHAFIRNLSQSTNTQDSKEKEKTEVEEWKRELERGGFGEGSWLDFDDDSVSSIPALKISTQYQGKSQCAYMLVYRKKESAKENVFPGEESVPSHIVDQVKAHNIKLAAERLEYETKINELDLRIITEKDIQIEKETQGLIASQLEQQTSETSKDSTKKEEDKKEEKKRGIDITVDQRMSYSEFKSLLTNRFSKDVSWLEKSDGIVLTEISSVTEKLPIQVSKSHSLFPNGSTLTANGSDPIRLESELNRKLAGSLRDGINLLIWNGSTINGQAWSPRSNLFQLNVKYFLPIKPNSKKSNNIESTTESTTETTNNSEKEKDSKEEREDDNVPSLKFELTVSENSTLKDLKERLHKLINESKSEEEIQFPEMQICKVESGRLVVFKDEVDVNSLYELSITSSSTITLESKKLQNNELLAKLELYKSPNTIQVLVTNNSEFCKKQSHDPSSVTMSRSIDMDCKRTVRELKERIITELFPTLNISSNTVKLTVNGEEVEEGANLEEVGISDATRVVLEDGQPISSDKLNLRFVVAKEGKARPETYQISIHKESSVLDCKTAMAAKIFKAATNFRLRKTDAYDMPDILLDDEEESLSHYKISQGNLLWLEEGKPPLKGQITIYLQIYQQFEGPLWKVDPNFKLRTAQESSILEQSKPEKSNEKPDESKSTEKMDDSKSNEPQPNDSKSNGSKSNDSKSSKKEEEKAATEEDKKFFELRSPALHLGGTYTRFLYSPQWKGESHFKTTNLDSIDVSAFIRLDELKQLVFSKFADEFRKLGIKLEVAAQFRCWSQDKLIRKDDQSLKKNGIVNDSTITFEVVDKNEVVIGGSSESESSETKNVVLWVQESLNSHFSKPTTIIFNGTNGTQLLAALNAHISNNKDNKKAAYVAKFDRFSSNWSTISDEVQNLKNKPYSLKEGDLIVYSMTKDDFSNTVKAPKVSSSKSTSWYDEQYPSSGSHPRSKRAEPELKIDINFDDED